MTKGFKACEHYDVNKILEKESQRIASELKKSLVINPENKVIEAIDRICKVK